MVHLKSIDKIGHLIIDEDKVMRYIPKEHIPFYRELFSACKLEDLGFIKSTIVYPVSEQSATMVIESKKLPFPSYPSEWSFHMIQDAAVHLLNVEIELLKRSYGLHDAHVWNVMFDQCRPCFIDIGSIESAKDLALSDFVKAFLMHSFTLLPIYRLGTATYRKYALSLSKLYNHRYYSRLLYWLSKALFFKGSLTLLKLKEPTPLDILTSIRDTIQDIKPPHKKTRWGSYYQDLTFSYTDYDKFTNKEKSVLTILERLKKNASLKTVLDMGTNKGFFANIAERLGFDVGGIDSDDTCIDELYLDAKKRRAKITPLVMDIIQPTPAHGLDKEHSSAFDRLRSDITIWMALEHHLVFKGKASFETVTDIIDKFTKCYAIVEFVPPDDKFISGWVKPNHSWYNLDNFMKHMITRFPKYEIFQSEPHPRITILFERKGKT